MKTTRTRLLSLLLALAMVFSMLPVSAMAADGESTVVTDIGDADLSVTDQSQEGEEGTQPESSDEEPQEEPVAPAAEGNVAKVGNTEYATIDEAIAAWSSNTTLTLLADVTLPDVITLKSTEHHILNLGTYIMTAASGKNAFVIQACGTGSAERSAITINADATNPGGINAGSKCVVYYKYADGGISTEDRPIIKINGGVFTGSTSSWGTAGIYTIGTAARKCATVHVTGGTFNCSIVGSSKSKLIVSGGTFNYTVSSQGDSTCSRLISGGAFKTLGFMTADSNNTKFWIGTSMGNSNVGVHVDDNGYIVVGGPVVTEAGETFEASSANYSGASSYLQYSSAAEQGLYYTSVEEALADNNKTSGSVTVYVDELDMTGISYKGTIIVPEESTLVITNAPADLKVTNADGDVLTPNENGSYTTVVPKGNVPYAYVGQNTIWGETWSDAKVSYALRFYNGTTHMGTTTLNPELYTFNGNVAPTWHINFVDLDGDDEWWIQEWTVAPTLEQFPDRVELWVDGVKTSEGPVQFNGPDNLNKIVALAADQNGKLIGAYTKLADAIGKFNGRTVRVLCDVTEDIAGFYGVTFVAGAGIDTRTRNTTNGVTITNTNTDWVDFDDVTVKSGVTLNIPNVYSGDSVNVIEGTLNVGETYYHGYDAKTTIQNGGKVTVGDSTILRYNESADAGLYIYGDGDDSTVEFDCNYYIGAYSGAFYAENADIETGYFLLKNSYDDSSYADIHMTMDNSTLTVVGTSDTQDSFIIDDQAHLTLKNAAAIADVRDFNILADTNLSLSVDETSSISATYMNIAEGVPFEAKQNADGSFSVSEKIYVVQIGETKYTSLQTALDAAAAGTGNVTVEILCDIDLTNVDWNPVTVSAPGYPVVTVNGNGKTITGLNDMLFAGTWAGGSGLIINDLTIADSNIVNDKDDSKGTVGVGAFIGFPQASATITLNNCHLVNSTVEGGHWTGGLIGYAAGYAGTDGPVFMNLTIEGCSVTDSAITGKGSVGGIIGHATGNAWTNVAIENTTVSGNTVTSTGSSTNKAGAVVGTIGAAGQATTVNGVEKTGGVAVSANVSGNTVTSAGTTITTIYGRQGSSTGELVVAGGTYDNYPIEEGVSYAAPADGYVIEENADGTYGVAVDPAYGKAAKIGTTYYATLAEAVAAAKAGDEIILLADTAENVTVPAGVIFNGNGKQVGVITAAGEITFKGYTKATNFGVQNANTTINIGKGACLEITGTGRLVIGHGCTFNITGTITDAKTADKASIQPSLIMPGASFTGAGVTFNVTNAYVKVPTSYASSSKSASGTFDFNITNSIWESAGKLAFESQSTAATVNFELKDSVLTTGSHLVFGVSRGEVVIDNSNVNVGTSRQIENQSTMTVKNGSVVNGAVATSSNAKNPGTLIVENATYSVTGEFSGADLGTGTLIVRNGANFTAGSITKANIQIDATGMKAGDEINITANLSKHDGTLEVINNGGLEAKIVDGKIVLVEKPVASINGVNYTTLEEAFKAATEGCTIEILTDVVVDYKWDCRDYATNGSHSQFKESVTINGNGHTIKFTGTISDGNWNTIFRFEENATVNQLTVDISEATGAQRVISAKKSLTVDGLTIIGSARYGVIFGEGASAADLAAAEIVVKDSTLTGTRRAISDNEGGKDVKSVTVTGNTLNANVYLSAFESITFNDNTAAGEVDLRSYTANNTLNVAATGNVLNTTKKNYIEAGGTIDAQDDFVRPARGEIAYRGYIEDSASREALKVDLQNIYAKNSVVVKLYDANGNLLITTTLKAGGFEGDWLTTNIVLSGTASGSWDTVISAEKLTVANVPTKAELWIDGALLDTFEPILGNKTDAAAYQLPAYIALDCVYKAAKIGETYYATFADAFAAAQAGDTIVLLDNIDLGADMLKIEKALTIDLNGKTIQGTNRKTFEVYADATFKNGTLLNKSISTGSRCIDTRVGGITLNLENMTINASNQYQSQPITIGGNAGTADNKITVNITNSEIIGDVGHYGYGIMVFNPVVMTITDSSIKGASAIDLQAASGSVGSVGSTVTIVNSDFEGMATGGDSAYGIIVLRDKNITVTMDADSSITTTGTDDFVRAVYLASGSSDVELELLGEINTDKTVVNGGRENVTITVADENVAANLKANGYVVVKNSDGTYGATFTKAAAKVNGVVYASIADALAAAKAGDTVTILAGNYTTDISVNKAITLVGETDAEGNNLVNITGQLKVYSGTTVKNLNVHNDKTGDYACALNVNGSDIVIDGVKLTGYNGMKYCYAQGNVTIKNSTINGSDFAVHFDGSNGGSLTIENCDITGWVSYGGGIDVVTLKNSTLKKGPYAGQRSYADNLVVEGCTFEEGYKLDIAVEDSDVTVTDSKMADGSDIIELFNKEDIVSNDVTIDSNKVAYVAKIGSVYYTSLEEALADVTSWTSIKLVADATLDYGAREAYGRADTEEIVIDGQGFTLTLNQTNSDWSSVGMKNAAGKLTLKNMTIEKTGYGDTSGAWNTHAIIFSCNVELNNVTVNNSVAVQNGATLKNVTINEANGFYGLWINGNGQTVTMDGGAINATNGGRGIKIADQYVSAPESVTLKVTGTQFNTAKKAAILVSSKAGAAITASNVDITNVAADSTNIAWVDEDWAADYGKVTVNNVPAAQENAEAFTAAFVDADGKVLGYYKTLAAALAAAKAGDTIELLVPYVVKAGETVELDLKGATVKQSKECTASYDMILNKGTLTIKDSVGGGKISFKDTSAGDPTASWGSYTIRNEGTLVIEGGTIENLSEQNKAGQAFAHTTLAIFQYSGSTTINGGVISTPNYRSVRLWSGDMTINGGTFEGQVWVHCVNDTSKLTINGGEFAPRGNDGSSVFVNNQGKVAELNVTGGTFATRIGADSPETLAGQKIAGGTFTEAAKNGTNAALIAQGFIFQKNSDGTYGVKDDPKTHYISNLAELKAFRDSVNAGNTYAGVTVHLAADIDLNGEEWTPIGSSSKPFNGSFDGQNHTISNLVINGGSSSDQGFFGRTNSGEIRNLTFHNAKVSGRLNVGVVAGTPYTSKYTNIKVTGHVEVNGMAYVGGVGGKNAYANWTDITVDVDDTSYVKAVSTENGIAYRTYVGGVIGFIGEGGHTFKNISSNIKVIGDVCDIGGLFGIAHYGNNFENVTFTGAVEAPEGAEEVGGIAGVWHNQVGTTVTFTNVTSTGTVTVGDETTTGSIVGGAYNSDNETPGTTGSLIIDGQEAWICVAKIGENRYQTIADAMQAAQAGDTVTILAGDYTTTLNVNKAITVQGEGTVNITGKLNVTADGAAVKNINVNNGSSTAGYISAKDVLIEGCTVVGGNGFRYCYTSGTVTFKDSTITGSTYGIHFDGSAGGNIVIDNCVITGWTSFAGTIEKVAIKDTTFAEGNYNQLRFYQDAEMTNVVFNPEMTIDFGKDEVEATFTDCSVSDGSALTDVIYLPDIAQMGIEVTVDDEPIVVEAMIGDAAYLKLADAFTAAKNDDEVKIYAAGTYALSTSGKNITITGMVEGVVFDNIGMKNMGSASVTFNNVTFDYYPNVNYTGLQHSGDLVYNNCTFNGQVFLYGTSETFNNCTFNQNSADAYNVWTYSAKEVAFNNCTFNSAGKSVLIYHESASVTNDVAVTGCTFVASSAVEGKAAIEMDSSLSGGIKLTIDGATTATGFSNGNVSGNSLWNNKKGNNTDANNDITVVVNNETVLAPVTFVAKIDTVGYTSFADALAAAQAGETITLLAPIVVAAGETLTLDKDVTITYTSNVPGEDMITNRGTLIVDGATLVYTNTDTTASNVTVSTISAEPGSVTTVKSGTVRNDSANNGATGIYAYAIDLLTNGSLGDVTANILGGEVIGTNYMAIRQFNNGEACKNTLNVRGGYIYGAKRAIQIHMKNNAAYTNISGGKVEGGDYALCFLTTSENVSVTGGEFKGQIWYSGTEGFISGGTFTDTNAKDYLADGYELVVNDDGLLEVRMVPVASVGGKDYASLQEAIEAANGLVVYLKRDVVLKEPVVVPGAITTTLNLSGYTISQEKACTAHYAMIENKGSLTITGNGKISFTDTGAGDPNFGWGSYTIVNRGTLVVENGTIEHLGQQNQPGNVKHMYCAIQQSSGTTTINGGTISTPTYRSVRVNGGELIVNGGTFNGQVWVQPNQGDCSLTVTGGTFAPAGGDASAIFLTNAGENKNISAVSITGGTFNGKIGASDAAKLTGIISGGIFTEAAKNGTNAALIAENMDFKANDDGTYGLVVVHYVAEVNGVKYESLSAAVEAAEENATITLLADGQTATVSKAVTIVKNGHTAAITAGEGYVVEETEESYEVKEQVSAEQFGFVGSSMVLGNELNMNFYVLKENIQDGYYARVTKTYADGSEDLIVDIPQSQWKSRNNMYYFTFNGIYAMEMSDDIYVEIYNAEGEVVSERRTDSVRAYAMRALQNSTDAKEKVLVVDMLNYGAAAQNEFSYNVENLANALLSEEQAALATGEVAVANKQEKGENFVGTSLTLDYRIEMNMYFENITRDMRAVVTFTDFAGDEHVINVSGAAFVARGSYLGVKIEELAVADATAVVTCEIYDGEELVASGKDSIESITARSGESLFKMIMKFSVSAYAYFN